MTLLTPSSASVSAEPLELRRVLHRADADDAALPGLSRGTECTVPILPGLVSVIVVPAKSSAVSLLPRARADDVFVRREKLRRSHGFARP